MKNNNTNYTSCLAVLTIQEVAPKIKLKDFEATKRWLEQKGIKIFKLSKQNVVYELDVDVEIDLNYAKELKRKYPVNWQNIYKTIAKDEAVFEMVKMRLEGETSSRPKTKVQLNTKEDNKILKLLRNA